MLQWIYYLKLFFWKYIPYCRPKNFVVQGKFSFTRKTKFTISINSRIEIRGNADFSDSIIKLIGSELICNNIICNQTLIDAINSKLTLGDAVNFKNSNLLIENSEVTAKNHFRIHHYDLKLSKSMLNLESYFLCMGNTYTRTDIQLVNSLFFTGENSRIQAQVLVCNGTFKLGNNSFINSGTIVNCQVGISIGNYVMISYNCYIFDNNTHSINYLKRRNEINNGFPNGTLNKNDAEIAKVPIIIKDDVWIGVNSMILKGSILNTRAIVAGGTVVTKNVPESNLVYGNPNRYKLIKGDLNNIN